MRLIDADELRAKYQAILDRGDMFCEYDIIGMVDDAPTVDEGDMQAVLNKRCMTIVTNEYLIALQGKRLKGKWIPQTDYYGFTYWKCSECGRKNDYEITNFCFSCGTDMRGEAEE